MGEPLHSGQRLSLSGGKMSGGGRALAFTHSLLGDLMRWWESDTLWATFISHKLNL